ncbi:MAG: hypothetical protein WC124_04795 [Desulfoplanes sp.]|nr:hypothetical protein [Desulfoplanes sp.]
MSAQPVKVISYPPADAAPTSPLNTSSDHGVIDDLFAKLASDPMIQEREKNRQERVLGEIQELQRNKQWQDIVDLFYPVAEKEPDLVEFGLDVRLRREIAFALGQLGKIDLALEELDYCLVMEPNSFLVHSALAFNYYRSLMAAANKEIFLLPAARKERLAKAHLHLQKAQSLMPDRVTNFYREGKVYKDLERNPEAALPLFAKAVSNWNGYSPEIRNTRTQERKNYIKALYNLASCSLGQGRNSVALEHMEQCIREDEKSGYVKSEHKYFALGKTLFAMNSLDKARQALECAATFIDPVEGNYIRELMGRVLLGLGEKEKAYATVASIPLKARRPFVCWTLADCLGALGRLPEAKNILVQSAQRDRRSRHKSLLKLARIAYQEHDFAKVIQYGTEANQFHLETFTTIYADGLFWVVGGYLALGNIAEARNGIREIKIHRPRYPFLGKLEAAVAKAEKG